MSFSKCSRGRAIWASVFLGFVVSALTPSALASSLVSVAFTGTYPTEWGEPNPPLVSGPESAATAANPLFGAANVWNNLELTDMGFELLSDPSVSNLLDSTGGNSGIGFSITGNVGAAVDYDYIPNPDPLRSEYITFNGNGTGEIDGTSDSIMWSLTGLVPGATYDMCLYGSRTNYDRNFNMTIQGTTLDVPSYNTTDVPLPGPDCIYFSNLVASGSGTITGLGVGIGSDLDLANEADWSGFQLVRTPEPCSLMLVGLGSLGIVIGRKRRSI